MNRPLLVTGSHRSGTSWLAGVLDGSGQTSLVYEPLNPRLRSPWTTWPAPDYFPYIGPSAPGTHRALRGDLDRLFGGHMSIGRLMVNVNTYRSPKAALNVARLARRARRGQHRLLVKDPFLVFCAPYLMDRYGAQVVVTVRHPAAFAASLIDKGWTFDFAALSRQPLLMRKLKPDLSAEIRAASLGKALPIVEQAALLWRSIYGFVNSNIAACDDAVIIRHEDAVANPLGTFTQLYARLGLGRPPSSATRMYASTQEAARFVDRWRMVLDAEQREFLKQTVGPECEWLYGSASW